MSKELSTSSMGGVTWASVIGLAMETQREWTYVATLILCRRVIFRPQMGQQFLISNFGARQIALEISARALSK